MLILNAIWDILSCVCIWQSFCVKDVHSLITQPPPTNQEAKPLQESCEQAQPLLTIVQTNSNEENTFIIPILDFIQGGVSSKKKIHEMGWKNALCLAIAEMHTSMWIRKTDATNYAACMLMAWWVLTLGIIRLYAAYNRGLILIAACSYALEGIFFLSEALKTTMSPKMSCYASIFCFLCLLLCVIKIPDS